MAKDSTLQLYVAKNAELAKLSRDEADILGLLAEFGELPAKDLSNLGKIPYSKIHSLLFSLQNQSLIVAYGEAPKLFAVRYEYPVPFKR